MTRWCAAISAINSSGRCKRYLAIAVELFYINRAGNPDPSMPIDFAEPFDLFAMFGVHRFEHLDSSGQNAVLNAKLNQLLTGQQNMTDAVGDLTTAVGALTDSVVAE